MTLLQKEICNLGHPIHLCHPVLSRVWQRETLLSLTKENTGFFCICEGLFWRPHFRLCKRDLNFWPWSQMHKRDLNLACTKETLISRVQKRDYSCMYKQDIALFCTSFTKETWLSHVQKRHCCTKETLFAFTIETSLWKKRPYSFMHKRALNLAFTKERLLSHVQTWHCSFLYLFYKRDIILFEKRNLTLTYTKETWISDMKKRP